MNTDYCEIVGPIDNKCQPFTYFAVVVLHFSVADVHVKHSCKQNLNCLHKPSIFSNKDLLYSCQLC